MTEPGSGPEQPDEPPALGREFRRTDAHSPRFDSARRRAPTDRSGVPPDAEVQDDVDVESPDAGDIDGIVEALRAKVEQDPPSLGGIWDEVTQQTLATYWPDGE